MARSAKLKRTDIQVDAVAISAVLLPLAVQWSCPGRRATLTPTSAAADFGDQVDFAVGVERDEVGVLEDLAVDRHRHAFVDLAAETGKAAVELQYHAAEIVRLHLELGHAAGKPAGGLARDDDARHCHCLRFATGANKGVIPGCPAGVGPESMTTTVGQHLRGPYAWVPGSRAVPAPRKDRLAAGLMRLRNRYSAALRTGSCASIAARNRGGDIGRSRMRMPIASAMALATAAIGGTIGTSPTPRAPKGWRGFALSTMTVSIIGRSGATGTG